MVIDFNIDVDGDGKPDISGRMKLSLIFTSILSAVVAICTLI